MSGPAVEPLSPQFNLYRPYFTSIVPRKNLRTFSGQLARRTSWDGAEFILPVADKEQQVSRKDNDGPFEEVPAETTSPFRDDFVGELDVARSVLQ